MQQFEIFSKFKEQQSSDDQPQKHHQPHQQNKLQRQNSHDVNQEDGQQYRKEQNLEGIFPSPYLNQYQTQFRRNRTPPHYINFSQNFLLYGISCKKQNSLFNLKMIYKSRNNRIVHYEVVLSYFRFRIKILNITKDDNFMLCFQNEINKGMYGTVYNVKVLNKNSAVKEIDLGKNYLITIQNAVYQYSFMKIMSAIQCGPKLQMIFGFDIIVSDKSLYFSAQKCINVWDYAQRISLQLFQQKFQQLQISLLQMHYLNICHNDIKPFNILYSPSLDKLVFIDFGFSQIKNIRFGQMQEEKAKGSFYYSCNDMKNAFTSPSMKGLVDTYYNDYYGLKKTKQTLLNSFQHRQPERDSFEVQFQSEFRDKLKYYESQLSGIDYIISTFNQSDYFVFLVCFLISQNKIQELQRFLFQNKQSYKLLDFKLPCLYWIFLEIDYCPRLENCHKKIKQILFKNGTVSFQSKKIVQNILDPYFKGVIEQIDQLNQPLNIYMQQQRKFKQIFCRRYNQKIELISNENSNNNNKIPYRFTNPFLSKIYHVCFECNNESCKNQKILNINLSKLSNQERDQLIQTFNNLGQTKLVSIVTKIQAKFNNFHSLDRIKFGDLIDLQKIFKKGNIHITVSPLNNHKFSVCYGAYMWLNMILLLLKSFIKRFSLDKALLSLLKQDQNSDHINVTINIFFNKAKSQNQSLNLQEYEKNLFADIDRYNVHFIKLFQQSLMTWMKIFKIYRKDLSYNEASSKSDDFVKTLTQKILEIMYYKYSFNHKILSFKIVNILNAMLEIIYIFIYEIGINSYLGAQMKGDYKRSAFYYNHLFHFSHYQKFIGQCKKDLQNIAENSSIFFLTKDISNLIAYIHVLPKDETQKYQIPSKIEKFIKIVQKRQFRVENNHTKQVKTLLFWEYLQSLSYSFNLIAAITKFEKRLNTSEFPDTEQIDRAFYFLWKQMNNNLKIKQAERRIFQSKRSQINGADFLNLSNQFNLERIKQKNQIKITKNQLQKPQIQNNKLKTPAGNREHLSNAEHIELKDLLKKKFIQLLEVQQYDLDLNLKSHYFIQIINQQLNRYSMMEGNLEFYLQNYKRFLITYEKQIIQRLRTMRKLKIFPSIYHFINISVEQRNSDSQFITKMTQNQFWLQLQKGWILSGYSKIMFLLLNNMKNIRRTQLIFDIWNLCKTKIQSLYKQDEYPLNYRQLQCRILQCQYLYKFRLYKHNFSSQNQIIVERSFKNFIEQIKLYLNHIQMIGPQNPCFTSKMKNNKFYPDALIKIYKNQLVIQGFDPLKAKKLFIEFSQYIIEKQQFYILFADDEVNQRILVNIVQIGLEQIYDLFSSQRYYPLSQTERVNLLLYKLLRAIGNFAQSYPCSNYTKRFVMIADCVIKKLYDKMRSEKSNKKSSNQQFPSQFNCQKKLDPIPSFQNCFFFLKTVFYEVFLYLVTKQSISYLKLIYLKISNFSLSFILPVDSQQQGQDLFGNLNSQNFPIEIKCSKNKKKVVDLIFFSFAKISQVNFDNLEPSAKNISIHLVTKIFTKIFTFTLKQNENLLVRKLKYLYWLNFRYFAREFQFDECEQPICLQKHHQENQSLIRVQAEKLFQKKYKRTIYNPICKIQSLKYGLGHIYLQKIKQKIIARICIVVRPKQQRSSFL